MKTLLPALGAFSCLVAVGGVEQAHGQSVADRVGRLFGPWDRTNSPGAVVVVVKDGAVIDGHVSGKHTEGNR